MKSTIILLALSVAFATAMSKKTQRIVGGSITDIAQYPSITSLLYSQAGSIFTQACGGTIINTRTVLTAAHCTSGNSPSSWRVRVGSTYANSGGFVYSLLSITNHPSYVSFTFDNDIAIIRTASEITYVNNAVQAAFFAGTNYFVPDNAIVYAAGWGRIAEDGPLSEVLRDVQIWTVNQEICRTRYASIRMTVTDNMLCSGWLDVGGRDQCTQDSGGPLYHNGVVIGVSSWGNGCGRPEYPGVSARVSRYAAWIQANA